MSIYMYIVQSSEFYMYFRKSETFGTWRVISAAETECEINFFFVSGKLKRRFYLEGHVGWITSIEITDTMVISGSKAGL